MLNANSANPNSLSPKDKIKSKLCVRRLGNDPDIIPPLLLPLSAPASQVLFCKTRLRVLEKHLKLLK